jgi:hypothetical protein
MDDREQSGGVGARPLDHWRVFQVVTKSGVTTLVAHEPVSQQVRLRLCCKSIIRTSKARRGSKKSSWNPHRV